MNQVTKEQKDRVMMTLAVIGFLAVVVIGVWLAVQIVGYMPQAFSSLASLADSVYNYEEAELNVASEKSVVNAGETFLLSWEDLMRDGVYTFTYDCADGVSVDVRDNTGSISTVTCGEAFTLGSDMNELEVTIASERTRFTDIAYQIGFVPAGASAPLATSSNMITVVNASIPQGDVVADEDVAEDEDVALDDDMSEDTDTTADDTATPAPTQQPQYEETVTYQTPVSDPLGYTDLAVKLLAVGRLDADGDFEPRSNMDVDERGAFQFEVVNLGTKTSAEWEFDAELTSNSDYESDEQDPLKPQERVVFTLGFDAVGEPGIHDIGVIVRGGNDVDTSNNSFTWSVSVVD